MQKQLRLKILKKLRTASLNSEFTVSYKKRMSVIGLKIFISLNLRKTWIKLIQPLISLPQNGVLFEAMISQVA